MGFSTEVRENRAFAAEIKFYVPPDRFDDLRDWARERLRADPFGSGPFGDTYQTNSLYFDTAALDVFREKLIKRGISLKALDAGEPQQSGKTYKLTANLVQGIASDKAKVIVPEKGKPFTV